MKRLCPLLVIGYSLDAVNIVAVKGSVLLEQAFEKLGGSEALAALNSVKATSFATESV